MKIKSVILKAFNGMKEGETISLKERNFYDLEAKGYVKRAPKTTTTKKKKEAE